MVATSQQRKTPHDPLNATLGLVPARLYQRRGMNCCCICRLGETEGGGLATFRVEGSTMGMALRVRWASGWWSFVCELDC